MIWIVPLSVGVGLLGGFAAGLWAYAHVYQHFLGRTEESVRRKFVLEQQTAKRREIEAVRAKAEMRKFYGDDLSSKHVEVMDEEIERVLAKGPVNGRSRS